MKRIVIFLLSMPLVFSQSEKAAGVVLSLTGRATVNGQPLHALDWIEANAKVQVMANSKLAIALENGRNFEMGAGAKGTVQASGLTGISGAVKEGKVFPPIPKAAPIQHLSSNVSGAARLRGVSDVKGLYPNRAAAIASRVTLKFDPVEHASTYSVSVENADGDAVFTKNTRDTLVAVPEDALAAGIHYTWRVRAMGDAGELAEGGAEFTTLSSDSADQRANFAKGLETAGVAMRLALLADIDLRLSLLAEACDEFEEALRLGGDEEIRRASRSAHAVYMAARSTP